MTMLTAEIKDVADLMAQATVNVQNEICFPHKGMKLNSKPDVQDFVDEIKKCDHMTALRLEGNSFGVEASAAIGEALKDHPEFESAYWSDMFTGRLKNEIPNALEHLGRGIIAAGAGLVELELSDNAFGPNGLHGLTTFLKSSSCYTLRILKLNNNGLGIFGGRMLSQCLLECHANSCKDGRPLALKVFVSGRNRLEDQGAMALADAFKAIGTLEEITMLQNFIQHEGVAAITHACRANKRLRLLNLNDNTFTEKGAISMAKVLPELPNLEVINFGDCLIRTEGAKALAAALTNSHPKLKEIYLNGNEIGPSAIDHLAQVSSNKTQLETFDLNANEFGSDGVKRLQCLMKENGTLELLSSLSDDEGDDEDEEDDDDDDDDKADESSDNSDDVDEITNTLQATVVTDPVPSTHHLHQETFAPTISLDEFLHDPTSTKFNQLGSEGHREFVEYISTMAVDIDRVILLYIAVSQCGQEVDTQGLSDVHRCTDELLQRLFSAPDSNPAYFINTLLTHLALIKHEDKKFVPPINIGPCLSVLNHNVQQAYFNKSARTLLLTFIDRPHPLFEKCTEERHALLQILYTL